MKLEGILATALDVKEVEVIAATTKRQSNLLSAFQQLQDQFFLLLVNNSALFAKLIKQYKPVSITYRFAVRMLSISQIAMRINLMGYPLEAITIARTMQEILRVNTYLLNNPEAIDSYLSGELKATKILVLESKLYPEENNAGFELWKLASSYSHANPSQFEVFTDVDMDTLTLPLLVTDPIAQDGLSFQIVTHLFSQYTWLRTIVGNNISISEATKTIEKEILEKILASVTVGNRDALTSKFTALFSHIWEVD